MILSDGDTIHARHLNLSFRAAPGGAADDKPSPWTAIDLSGTLADVTRRVVGEVERRKMEHALKEADGNRSRAAQLLQVSYKTFMAKLRELQRLAHFLVGDVVDDGGRTDGGRQHEMQPS